MRRGERYALQQEERIRADRRGRETRVRGSEVWGNNVVFSSRCCGKDRNPERGGPSIKGMLKHQEGVLSCPMLLGSQNNDGADVGAWLGALDAPKGGRIAAEWGASELKGEVGEVQTRGIQGISALYVYGRMARGSAWASAKTLRPIFFPPKK